MSAPHQAPIAQPMNDHDRITNLAYRIYLERMETGQEGSAEQDWYQAVAELQGD